MRRLFSAATLAALMAALLLLPGCGDNKPKEDPSIALPGPGSGGNPQINAPATNGP